MSARVCEKTKDIEMETFSLSELNEKSKTPVVSSIYASFYFDQNAIVCSCPAQMQLQGGPKSKPLPNYENIVLNRNKDCQ